MFSLNRAQIVGNLTRDPEMRYTPNGKGVTSFGVATNRRWKGTDGNLQEDTQFHEIVAWGRLAEIVTQILHKGNKVYVEGRLQTRSWEAQDGSKRQRTEIVMENFITLTPKGSAAVAPDIGEAIEEFPTDRDSGEKPPKKIAKEEPEKPKAKKEAKEEEENKDEINLDEIPF